MDAANDTNAATVPHEKLSPSQVAQRPTRTLTIGDRVGRYLVLSALGAGGMGVVFAAYDPQLDRKVALKLLRSGLTYNTRDARTRLRREAQAIAQLSHPNVVAVYDVGTTGEDDLYIAMEFVEGDTLTSWLKKYPRTWREIVDVFLQAARGLLAAHSVGLLHRDFKPDNVLVGGDGRVRVTDFGLARSVITPEEAGRPAEVRPGTSALNVELTATGTVLGTPRYMAPEQLTGPDIDARADQFSFCVALYEALYGAHPLPGATAVSMIEKHVKAHSPPDTVKVPSAVARAVMTGLEENRARRFPSMGALIAALAPSPQRSPVRSIALALAALVAVGVAVPIVVPLLFPQDLPVTPRPDPTPATRIQELQEQVKQRDAEISKLLAELKARPTVAKIHELQQEIEARDEEIKRLVTELKQRLPKPAPLPPQPRQDELATSAIGRTRGDLASCLVEWSLREPGDARLGFKMTVSAEGVGHSVLPLPDTAVDDRLGPSLRACVGAVLERALFRPGPENLDLQVTVQWNAEQKALDVSAGVVGRRKPP